MVDTLGQYEKIRAEIETGIREVLESTAYINGPSVHRFTENLSNFLDAKVIACANGTDAIQVALMALGLQPGDEVITPTFTFVATAEVIALLGLTPVMVDVDPDTFNISTAAIEAAITPKTKCIIPVHLFGQPADMEKIMQIADKHNIFVVEDNAQSIGADYLFRDGSKMKVGTIGHIGCTSFYPSKNLGAYGDAGAVFSRDEKLADKIRLICNHGSKVKYQHIEIGVNSRLDSIQAVVLDTKLKYLETYNSARQMAAEIYDSLLKNIPGIQIPVRTHNGSHIFHQYTIRILAGKARRDAIKKGLEEKGVPTMIYYPASIHQQAAFKKFPSSSNSFPESDRIVGEVLSLPMHTELDRAQIEYICNSLTQTLTQNP